MTTCAWDGKTLAADMRVTGDMEHLGNESKIYRFEDRLVACAGSVTGLRKFLRWYEKDRRVSSFPVVPREESYEVMTISPDGCTFWCNEGPSCKLEAPAAIGSGARFAIGAMLAGKTAIEAVQIASIRDLATGPDVEYLTLDVEEKEKDNK